MADNYDLCIDVTELGVQGAVAMVSAYIDLLGINNVSQK